MYNIEPETNCQQNQKTDKFFNLVTSQDKSNLPTRMRTTSTMLAWVDSYPYLGVTISFIRRQMAQPHITHHRQSIQDTWLCTLTISIA